MRCRWVIGDATAGEYWKTIFMKQIRPLRVGTVCSGIAAPETAWRDLCNGNRSAFDFAFCSEIEAFPCAVLNHHFPAVPNLGDMTKFREWPARCDCEKPDTNYHTTLKLGPVEIKIYVCSKCGGITIDILAGGTPCQSFSVAGLRKGLADPRGNLMLTFGAIAAKYRPRWLVWENVPGVLSSNEGRDFASFLGLVTGQSVEPPKEGWGNSGIVSGIGSAYGVAWRTLDAQYFGVAQRRRRVFVVGHLGGQWQRAAAVLFERESLSGNPPPRRETGKRIATTVAKCLGSSDGAIDREDKHTLIAFSAKDHGADAAENISPTLRAGAHDKSHANSGNWTAVTEPIPIQEVGKRESGTPMNGVGHGEAGDPMYTLQSAAVHGVAQPVAFAQNSRDEVREIGGNVAGALAAEPGMKQQTYIAQPIGIDGGEVGYALRANASHSGDKGDGGVNTTLVSEVAPCLKGNQGKNSDAAMEASSPVAHSLRGEGFDASEDGTGRGTPLVPITDGLPDGRIARRTDCPTDGLPEICGALSDGAHNGGGLNGQDAYTGRIIPASGVGVTGAGRERSGQQHERGSSDSDASRRFL